MTQLTHTPAAGGRKPGQHPGARQRGLVPRLGPGTVLLRAQPAGHAALRRALPGPHPVPTGAFASSGWGLPNIRRRSPTNPAGTGKGTVYASWNGATPVASWRLLAGASPQSLHALLTAPRAGFETAIPCPRAPRDPTSRCRLSMRAATSCQLGGRLGAWPLRRTRPQGAFAWEARACPVRSASVSGLAGGPSRIR